MALTTPIRPVATARCSITGNGLTAWGLLSFSLRYNDNTFFRTNALSASVALSQLYATGTLSEIVGLSSTDILSLFKDKTPFTIVVKKPDSTTLFTLNRVFITSIRSSIDPTKEELLLLGGNFTAEEVVIP